jgi:uncharacterized protein YjbI with pentapeptide repeats
VTESALKSRWRSEAGARLTTAVLERLRSVRPLEDLPLDRHEGRLDLRGLTIPTPERSRRAQVGRYFVEELDDLLEIAQPLEQLDFSGAVLDHLRFFEARIDDCLFEGTRCRDWRLWATDVTETSFRGADLRKSALGGWHEQRGNVYVGCDFSAADLRDAECRAAEFVDCVFDHTRLDEVDFGSSAFVRCRFAGELREVIFYDHGFQTGKPTPNEMRDVDFTDAELHWVEFRGLDLSQVRLPESPNHLIVDHYPCVLRRAVDELASAATPGALRLLGYIEGEAEWTPETRRFGILNRRDLDELAGEEAPEFAESLLRRLEAECAEAGDR